GTPTGTVNFLDGGANIGTGTLNASGVATLTTTALAMGSHNITANYIGTASFAPSSSAPLMQTVQMAAPGPVNATGVSFTSVEGLMTPVTVATFTDPSGNTDPSHYTI